MTTDRTDHVLESDAPGTEFVPEAWPPANPMEPVETRRVHWLLAVPAAIVAAVFPRRLGPHLASSSWAATYVAHIFSLLFCVGTVTAFYVELSGMPVDAEWSWLVFNPLHEVRRALAGVVLLLFYSCDSLDETLVACLIFAATEAAFWAAALFFVPVYTAGESRRRVYLRCVKLLLWSNIGLCPLAWTVPRILTPGFGPPISEDWFVVALLTWGVWWLSVIVRLGARYGGPKDGARWQPRRPRCEACGYGLTGLPLARRCPECGRPVGESLPTYRRPPAFAAARGLLGRATGFLRTTYDVWSARRFAERVTVWSHQRAARNYAWLVCVLMGVLSAVAYVPAWFAVDPRREQRMWYVRHMLGRWPAEEVLELVNHCLIAGLVVALFCFSLLLLIGLFVGWAGFRNSCDRVVVMCYSLGWLFVPLAVGLAGGWAAYALAQRLRPLPIFVLPGETYLDMTVAIYLAGLTPGAVTFLLLFVRLRRMLRAVRYANA